MKLIEFKPISGGERNKNTPSIRVYKKQGDINISKSLANLLEIKKGDKIGIVRRDNDPNYVLIGKRDSNEVGFTIGESKRSDHPSTRLRIHSKSTSVYLFKMLEMLSFDTVCACSAGFNISTYPEEVAGRTMYRIITKSASISYSKEPKAILEKCRNQKTLS